MGHRENRKQRAGAGIRDLCVSASLCSLILSLLLFTGCKDWEADELVRDYVRVPLAFTFSASPVGSHTRQGDNANAVEGNNRNVYIRSIIPLIGDTPDGSEVKNEVGPEDVTSSKFYYYKYCDMKPGADHCLVYGEAEAVGSKAVNGSLIIPNFPSTVWSKSVLNGFKFSLEPIYDETEAPAEGDAWKLAEALNAIIEDVPNWQTSTNAVMSNLFKNFTNHGFNLPGSAASVKQWMKELKAAAKTYIDSETSQITSDEIDILNAIVGSITEDKLNAITGTYSYPRDKGLPDGAAALRWTTWTDEDGQHTGFKPQLQTTTLDNINSVSRFAYPASLYFFVNSALCTSNTKRDYDDIYRDETDWNTVLSKYFINETFVSAETKAVALKDPVQYAVAQMKVKLSASDGLTLKDVNNEDVTFNFPLRGIIVCGQRPVNYLFEQPDKSDAEVKFIYDPKVKDNVTLSTTTQEVGTTLVLQSGYQEDVEIILEFENNSGKAFKCVDGTVYPETRFYLIGKIAWDTAGDTGKDGTNNNYVFTKDYITTVNMTVTSLAKAYNVLPNLLSSNLEIGVETTPQWVAATPTTIRLDE